MDTLDEVGVCFGDLPDKRSMERLGHRTGASSGSRYEVESKWMLILMAPPPWLPPSMRFTDWASWFLEFL